jgi:hypothetical protein
MKKFIIFSFLVISSLFIFTPKTLAATEQECIDAGGYCSGSCGTEGQLTNPSDCPSADPTTPKKCCKGISVNITQPNNVKITDMGKLIGALISAVFVIAGLIAFVFLIWGGIQWITSGGDKAGVEAAQKRIQAALIGLIIVVASWAIMSLVARFLGIDIFNLNFQTPF